MRLSLAAAVLAALTLAVPSSSFAAGRFVPPEWLLKDEQSVLSHTFGNATPVDVEYIPYPRKIAVIFQFSRVVVCGPCSSPTSASQPRGKMIRVSFDRRTHMLAGASNGWAMQFCEARDGRPPKSVCLHR